MLSIKNSNILMRSVLDNVFGRIRVVLSYMVRHKNCLCLRQGWPFFFMNTVLLICLLVSHWFTLVLLFGYCCQVQLVHTGFCSLSTITGSHLIIFNTIGKCHWSPLVALLLALYMAPTIVVLCRAISAEYHWFQLVEWFGHNCPLSDSHWLYLWGITVHYHRLYCFMHYCQI